MHTDKIPMSSVQTELQNEKKKKIYTPVKIIELHLSL